MPPLSMDDLLRRSANPLDPVAGREALDALEAGQTIRRGGRRRISARFGMGGMQKPDDFPEPEYSHIGQDRVRTVYIPPPAPVVNKNKLVNTIRRRGDRQ